LLSCSSSNTCGSGQTVAIVDAFNDPNIQSDLNTFDSQFGLPTCTVSNGCLTIATPQGSPRTNRSWALEISLDVEWVHAIAPGAKILLVEAVTNSFANLFGAVDFAASQVGVHQVSMSWGGGEFSSEASNDFHFQVTGVTFFASSGDGGHGIIYPSASPFVVSVGGTTLTLGSGGNVVSETAWSGSGGGISAFESEPSYQTNYPIPSTGGLRGNPDVSYDADPASGVAVFDSLGFQGLKNWIQIGGTSAGSPQWAALNAIANAGRTSPLSSTSTTTPTNVAIYHIASTAYSTNFRDITSGTNGSCGSLCTAGTNYDFVTGLGSPLANALVPSLQNA
jgi:subtilase family serine protease